jgi:uncharacterized protein (TIGR03083 family)
VSLSRKEIRPLIHAERRRLIDDLDAIDGSRRETPSLCPGWTVHDILAHLVDVTRIGEVAFLRRTLKLKRDSDPVNEVGIRQYRPSVLT